MVGILLTLLVCAGVCWCVFAGRVLSTDTRHIAAHLTHLTNLLQPLGLDAADVRKLVLKQPTLLVANIVTIASHLEPLRVRLCPHLPGCAARIAQHIGSTQAC